MICEREIINVSTPSKPKGALQVNALQPGNVLLRAYIPSPILSDSRGNAEAEARLRTSYATDEFDEDEEGQLDERDEGRVLGSAKRPLDARDIRIVVVPAHPIGAVALQELVALLEATFHTQRPVFTQAKCFRYPDIVLGSDELRGQDGTSRQEKVHQDWVSIQRKMHSLSVS